MRPIQNIDLGEPVGPDPVSFSFDAPGWTYLLIVLVIIAIVLVMYAIWRYNKNAYRRAALKEIADFHGDQFEKARFANRVLKRLALRIMPRESVSAMGNDYLLELNQQMRRSAFDEIDVRIIQELNYGDASTITSTELQAHLSRVTYWIQKHKMK